MKRGVIVDDEYIVVNGIKAMIAREKMDFEAFDSSYQACYDELDKENS